MKFNELHGYLDKLRAEIRDATFAPQASEFITQVVESIKLVTPVAPFLGGRLREETRATDIVDYPGQLRFKVIAPAESDPNEDGSGGGQHYVQWVIGGRGEITAPSSGPFSTGKKALASRRTGFGPVKHVRAAKPQDYVVRAYPGISTALGMMVSRWADDDLSFLLGV